MDILKVQFAVYGALKNGDPNATQAIDATAIVQQLITQRSGQVKIDNSTIGSDPSPGNVKHFAAVVVSLAGVNQAFACQEGQTINFFAAQAPQG